MGEPTKAKAKGKPKASTEPTAEEKEREAARLDRRGIVLDLVGSKVDPAEIAQVIYDHPRYEHDIIDFVNDVGGNTSVNKVFDELDKLEQSKQRPVDHVGGVAGLGALAGQTAAVTETDKTGGGDRLPYDGRGGWDAPAINRYLSQYDGLAGTNNDDSRCAFATILAAKVFQGPSSFPSWLTAFRAQNGGKGTMLLEGQRVPAKVMDAVCDAIVAGTATFRDLAWLQEALYDYAVTAQNQNSIRQKDGVDTTAEVVSAATDVLKSTGKTDACKTSKDVVAGAKGLAEGSNLMIEWTFARIGQERLHHEMMISNHEGKLYLYDASGLFHSENLVPLTTKKLDPYFDDKVFGESEMKLAATLTAKAGVPKG